MIKMISKSKIEQIYKTYHSPDLLKLDPLIVVRKFKDKTEAEVFGLVAALFSYGRVERIIITLETILDRIDGSLLPFIKNSSIETKRETFAGIKHRFNDGEDLAVLFEVIKTILEKYGSIENCFFESGENHEDRLEGFTQEAKSIGVKLHQGTLRNFNYLFPSPSGGSGCKRLNMYLRWMVREDDGIDLGLWSKISSKDLIIPIDTHVVKISQRLKLTDKKNGNWKMALEITNNLKKFSKNDPTKYDFALCHWGMVELREK
jgi:uncharacterized protein (TIGR02757 family)